MNPRTLNRLGRWAIGAYLLLEMAILPLLSPLRALGVIEPGVLRNMAFPPLLLITVLTFGTGRVIKARSLLHVGFIFTLIQAMFVGIPNLMESETQRSYFSHLFQIGSAYGMLSVGWLAFDLFSHQFWKRFAVVGLVSTWISTAFTLVALGHDEIGRLYTPAYTLIFVVAFSAIYSNKMSALSILGMLVSNKRGPILSVTLIFFQQMFGSLFEKKLTRSKRTYSTILGGLGMVGAAALSVVLLVAWAGDPANEAAPVARAINITLNRFTEMTDSAGKDQSLDEISSGRFEEVELALSTMEWYNFLIGKGAGWSATLGDGKFIQNIHFSPLSLTVVFGAPFAIMLYAYLGMLVWRGTMRPDSVETLSTTERMAPLYLAGALLHSLFAYSLFVDWLVFIFAGVLLRSLSIRRRIIEQ